ncbi:MAG: hypothetical protein HQL38_16735 [Alphaproteobacteria bacterium]|nr:hypothetical protein [Alphaproteobacteria bacterium]MBF0394324.1 hypothetical protein [Alphaproteobacteria bacterium]
MAKGKEIADEIARRLGEEIRALPDRFHSSFDYVDTGNNKCHSSTLWILAKIVAGLDGVEHVGIDVPLGRKGAKIKPDVVGYGPGWSHAVYVDFESPNSSDTRVWRKDCEPYAAYRDANTDTCAPYVVVTSLPDRETLGWQLRWTNMTSKGPQYNHECRGMEDQVRRNPFRFWLGRWREIVSPEKMTGVTILNIDDTTVKRVKL